MVETGQHTTHVTHLPHMGTYVVYCDQGCNLGTSAVQPTMREADKRADLHRLATAMSDEARQEAIADGSDCGCPAFHHSCGIVSPDLRTDPRIHCAECGMPADEDGYCTAVDCPRCGKTARG